MKITKNLREDFSVISVVLEDGETMEPGQIPALCSEAYEGVPLHMGVVLSGRLPVWAYAALVHEFHPAAWVATYDPRLPGAVVVQRHAIKAPAVGTVVEI
jgi:CRISPR-associated protein Csx3